MVGWIGDWLGCWVIGELGWLGVGGWVIGLLGHWMVGWLGDWLVG